DPAGKPGIDKDYIAICVVGLGMDSSCYVLQVVRGHWTVRQMLDAILALNTSLKPDLVLVEDTASGMGLIQLLQEHRIHVRGLRSKDNKETRMSRHQARFEVGRIVLPFEALWLAEFERELLAFP